MFTVRFIEEGGWLEFSTPRAVLRAATADEAEWALDEAQDALERGYWIAGVVPYERAGLAIGVFEGPVRREHQDPAPHAVSPPLAAIAPRAYADAIAQIERAIYEGDVYQVNYTVPFDLAIDGDPLSLWQTVARETHARYQAYVEDGSRRILSWSPELFLAFDGTRVTTKPMKGTSAPGDTAPLLGEKNRAEHVMIVDLLRNDLRRFCSEVVVSALCSIERYPTFATMTSTIEGTMQDGVRLADIFRAAFPCGSITGAPKLAAMEQIARLETQGRGAYCGTIGFLSPQRRGWWNVAIRTAQIDGSVGRFDAGGGIVSDSTSADEWAEVLLKSSFLRTHANAFALWETYAGDAPADVVESHLERLRDAAQRLSIPLVRDRVLAQMLEAQRPETLVRMRVTLDGTVTFHHDSLDMQGSPVTIRLSAARVRSSDPWLRVKSSWRPHHRAAWTEAGAHGCFDALLRNERDEITEGSRTNLFAEIDGMLATPPLHCGLLPGILRSRILAEGRAHERVLRAGDLHRASALYVGNSARGLLRATLQE